MRKTSVTAECGHPAGFTLLEMSIVLTIIGVIIGGVMISWSMIIASRLQTVITDVDNYTTAVNNFTQQYQALPGDFANATAIWGTDSSGCTTGGGASGTCNGNGDGMIEAAPAGGQVGEMFLFWQHLYLAGMFNQSLKNYAGSTYGSQTNISINTPAGSIKGSGFSVIWRGNLLTSTAFFPGSYGNPLQFGAAYSDLTLTKGPVLTPDQAVSIDNKMDDGSPATGNVRSFISTYTPTLDCTTTAVPSTAAYNISGSVGPVNPSSKLCALTFVMGF